MDRKTDRESNILAARGLEELRAASKTIRRKIMMSHFLPNLSCLQNNPPENNVEPVSAKSELPPKTIRRKIMWSQFPPNLSWFLVLLLRISFLFLKNIETFLCK
jgi:hypothetical protein